MHSTEKTIFPDRQKVQKHDQIALKHENIYLIFVTLETPSNISLWVLSFKLCSILDTLYFYLCGSKTEVIT